MPIEDKVRDFNILVVDDDVIALESLKNMYNFMVDMGDFEGILGKGVKGTVSSAPDAKAAEHILNENLSKTPDLVQIMHVDERMPGERGSEFVDRMRRKHTDSNLGALLVTGYSTDVSVLNSRESGVYRYLSKPIDPPQLIPNIKDLVEMILLKDKPVKKEVEGVYIFRPLSGEQEIITYLQKRFEVWRKLNYIPDEFLSEKSGLEIDDYDKVSVPLGGFRVDKDNELAILARVITPRMQDKYIRVFSRILEQKDDAVLNKAFHKNLNHPFTILRDCDKNGQLAAFIDSFGGIDKTVEFSRIMDTGYKYRGQNLSTRMAQFHNMYAKYVLGANLGNATCLVKHVPHNIKNGFTGKIPFADTFDARRVEQVASAMFVDMHSLSDSAPWHHASTIRAMYDVFKNRGFVCYCKKTECIDGGYELINTGQCNLKLYKVIT